MKALPFIEVVDNLVYSLCYEDEYGYSEKIIEPLIEFYSQPFDMGMLVNPIKKPFYPILSCSLVRTEGELRMDATRHAASEKQCNKYEVKLKRWQEAEDEVLFEKDEFDRVGGDTWNDMCEFNGTLDEFINMFCFNPKKWKQSIVDKYFNH